jgi:hypothetical protein
MADILDRARREELADLAETVTSVADAHRIIEEHGLRADPANNSSIFYYGEGLKGATALSEQKGYVRIEQTERGYFLNEVTRRLKEAGSVPRGSEENKALFGDPSTQRLGEWGEASRDFAQNTRGTAVVFADPGRPAETFKHTAFYNAELPALELNREVKGLCPLSYSHDGPGVEREFGAKLAFSYAKPAFASDKAYGLNEGQLSLVRAGGETAADTLHALGGDFGAVELNQPSPAQAVTATQTVQPTRMDYTRSPAQSATAAPQAARGARR